MNIEPDEVQIFKTVKNAFGKMYSNGLQFCLHITASSMQLCAAIRSCTISWERWKGMNLIATPAARFTALNPQHNLALRSEGPISRQIAHHPTLTRKARSYQRIFNYEYYVFVPGNNFLEMSA
jgi:hypothetical protein